MNERKEVLGLLEKAEKSVLGARVLLKEHLPDFSASRAYYAMFYVAQALLLTKKLSFSRHAAVISTFGKEFAKPGLIDRRLHRYMRDAFRLRQAGDYDTTSAVSEKAARTLIEQGREFIDTAEQYLAKLGYLDKPTR